MFCEYKHHTEIWAAIWLCVPYMSLWFVTALNGGIDRVNAVIRKTCWIVSVLLVALCTILLHAWRLHYHVLDRDLSVLSSDLVFPVLMQVVCCCDANSKSPCRAMAIKLRRDGCAWATILCC